MESDKASRGPSFWIELYWLGVILLLGWILAVAVLPDKLHSLRESLAFESHCRATLEELGRKEVALKKSLVALEHDPVFREEAYRAMIGRKSEQEEFVDDRGDRR